MTFLGYIISSEGVEVDQRKSKAVKNCPIPLIATDIRSLLALAGYYHRFVEGFASIATPLTILTHKCKKFEWSEAYDRSLKC